MVEDSTQEAQISQEKISSMIKVECAKCRKRDMSEKQDPNKKHYFQPVDLDEFGQQMLIFCQTKGSQTVTVWERGENEDQAENYIAEDYDPEKKIITLNPTGKLITKITGSSKTGKPVLVKIPIESKIHYFTVATLKFHQSNLTYSLQISGEIFKSQQRGNFRLNASDVISIQFKINEQVFDALDISTGGTSFLVNPVETVKFAKGEEFKECTLRFDRKNYYIPEAVVASVKEMPLEETGGQKKVKIGIAFKNLARKTEDELYVKISTEARGEEMKKKFDTIVQKKSDQK